MHGGGRKKEGKKIKKNFPQNPQPLIQQLNPLTMGMYCLNNCLPQGTSAGIEPRFPSRKLESDTEAVVPAPPLCLSRAASRVVLATELIPLFSYAARAQPLILDSG